MRKLVTTYVKDKNINFKILLMLDKENRERSDVDFEICGAIVINLEYDYQASAFTETRLGGLFKENSHVLAIRS